MAIVHVQDATIGVAASAGSVQTGAFGANPTVGNYVVAWAWGWEGAQHPTAPAFSDTTGANTYTVPTGTFKDQASDLWVSIAYAKIGTSGAAFKVTCNPKLSNTQNSIMCCAAEFSGVAASTPQDGSSVGATGTSVTVAPGNLSLTSGSLVVGVASDDNTSYGGSTPTGFTRVGFQNNGSTSQVGEAIYAIDPTSPANPSRTIGSAKWAAAQFALLAAASAFTWQQLDAGIYTPQRPPIEMIGY